MQRQARHSHCGLAAIAGAIWLVSSAAAAAQDAAAEQPIQAYICKSDTASVDDWRTTITRLIGRAFATENGRRGRVMGQAECGVMSVEVACNAGVYDQGGPVMTCSPDTFLKLLRAGAWYTILYVQDDSSDYEAFRMSLPSRLGVTAFEVSAPGRDAGLDAAIEQLRDEVEAIPAGGTGGRAAEIFLAIESLVFAALIGHESAHMETSPPYCGLDTPSRLEESGLWTVVSRVSTSDEFFQPQNPDVGELRADRCGARRVRLARDVIEAGTLSAADKAFARRAAADIVSTILLVRLAPGQKPTMTIDGSYLYAPLRIIVLAGEINMGFEPVVCGGAAEDLVQAVQVTMQQRAAGGIMPDEIEAVFPGGVIDAWNGAAWSHQAYACQ